MRLASLAMNEAVSRTIANRNHLMVIEPRGCLSARAELPLGKSLTQTHLQHPTRHNRRVFSMGKGFAINFLFSRLGSILAFTYAASSMPRLFIAVLSSSLLSRC